MRSLSSIEVGSREISGGNVVAAVAVGGLVNSAIWGGWTTIVDNHSEKVTFKKCALTFALGALATYSGSFFL